MKKKKNNIWIVNYLGALCLLAIFVIGSLVLMNVGIRVYKNIVKNSGENFRLRASLAYVATKLHQYDQTDAITVEEKEGVPILVLWEQRNGKKYRTMIYAYDGALRELFQEESMEYALQDGLEVMDLDDFQIEKKDSQIACTATYNSESETLQLTLRSKLQ